MNISEHNRKVAISRWSKVQEKERSLIGRSFSAMVAKAAICGFLAGDGCVSTRKSHAEIGFYPDDLIMLRKYLAFMQTVYHKVPTVQNHNSFFLVRAASRAIHEDLNSVAEFGIKRWIVPWQLFNFKGAKEAWLRAFFSAEAYVGHDHIKVQTVNQQGMAQISVLLSDLGIEHRLYQYTPASEKHSQVHIIQIRGNARKKYFDQIGFWHSRKTLKLKKSLGL